MKIALECKSLLLQDSLHHYLSEYLCNVKDCDFIISDHLCTHTKPVFFLSFTSKTMPFVPEKLVEDLKIFHRNINSKSKPSSPPNVADDELKKEIQSLLMEFADRFLQILKKHK